MPISNDLKQEIWLGARCNGPLVQRVSASAMVVKCRPDEGHPLGYLHIYFQSGGGGDGGPKMWCECGGATIRKCDHGTEGGLHAFNETITITITIT